MQRLRTEGLARAPKPRRIASNISAKFFKNVEDVILCKPPNRGRVMLSAKCSAVKLRHSASCINMETVCTRGAGVVSCTAPVQPNNVYFC